MARFDLIACYIMSNRKQGALYVGVTSELVRRVAEHKAGRGSAFTREYRCTRLVWFEQFEEMGQALRREKRLKEWQRRWKIDLLEGVNPDWRDLAGELPLHRL